LNVETEAAMLAERPTDSDVLGPADEALDASSLLR
jgi:hypothetical protein